MKIEITARQVQYMESTAGDLEGFEVYGKDLNLYRGCIQKNCIKLKKN